MSRKITQGAGGLWIDPDVSRFTTKMCRYHKEVAVIFRTMLVLQNPDHVVALTGDGEHMGAWQTTLKAFEVTPGGGHWLTVAMLPVKSTVEFKWVVLDENRDVVEWESGGANRTLKVGDASMCIFFPWGKTSVHHLLNRPPKNLACVTFYTEYHIGSDAEKLFVYGSSAGLGKWDAKDTVTTHKTTSPGNWSAVALIPMHQPVIFKWGITDAHSTVIRDEHIHTVHTFTCNRYVMIKPYNGTPLIKSHAMKILPDMNDKDRLRFGNGQIPYVSRDTNFVSKALETRLSSQIEIEDGLAFHQEHVLNGNHSPSFQHLESSNITSESSETEITVEGQLSETKTSEEPDTETTSGGQPAIDNEPTDNDSTVVLANDQQVDHNDQTDIPNMDIPSAHDAYVCADTDVNQNEISKNVDLDEGHSDHQECPCPATQDNEEKIDTFAESSPVNNNNIEIDAKSIDSLVVVDGLRDNGISTDVHPATDAPSMNGNGKPTSRFMRFLTRIFPCIFKKTTEE